MNGRPAFLVTAAQADQIADALFAGALLTITETRDADPKSLRNVGLDETERQLREALCLLETLSGASHARSIGVDLAAPVPSSP